MKAATGKCLTLTMRSSLFLGTGAVKPKLLKWPARALTAEYVVLQHQTTHHNEMLILTQAAMVYCLGLFAYGHTRHVPGVQ